MSAKHEQHEDLLSQDPEADDPVDAGVVEDPGDAPEEAKAPDTPAHRLEHRPENPTGVYIVLAAQPLDDSSEPLHEGFLEVAYFEASDEAQAKRYAVADAEAGHDEVLKIALGTDEGILLRAVPARSWGPVRPSRYEQAAPKLVIG